MFLSVLRKSPLSQPSLRLRIPSSASDLCNRKSLKPVFGQQDTSACSRYLYQVHGRILYFLCVCMKSWCRYLAARISATRTTAYVAFQRTEALILNTTTSCFFPHSPISTTALFFLKGKQSYSKVIMAKWTLNVKVNDKAVQANY